LKGTIEDLKVLKIEDNSIDIVISNCVLNLCDDKAVVLKEIWRVLKPGGELYFSDVYSDRRVPEHLRKDKVLWGECISGALYTEDFRRIMQSIGFYDFRLTKESDITINNKNLEE
jgi:ubiquinone/menaquinone biosynthesis C-methylase UbiE